MNAAPFADTLAQWRAQHGPGVEAVRFAMAEALARRAASHHGAVRERLDARLAALVAELRTALDAHAAVHAATPAGTAGAAAGAMPERGRIGALVHALAQHGAQTPLPASQADGIPGGASGAPSSVPSAGTARPVPELATLRRFRGTWSRLSAEERLRQTLAQVPAQAGPLHSLHLAHRALVLMRDVSPQYLQRFVAHVDSLLWLEQVQQAALAPAPVRRKARGGR